MMNNYKKQQIVGLVFIGLAIIWLALAWLVGLKIIVWRWGLTAILFLIGVALVSPLKEKIVFYLVVPLLPALEAGGVILYYYIVSHLPLEITISIPIIAVLASYVCGLLVCAICQEDQQRKRKNV